MWWPRPIKRWTKGGALNMIKKVILTPNPYRDGGFRTVQSAQKILQ